MTVRRDLMELEKMNLIQRFHGGAVISFGRSYEARFFPASPRISKENEE